MDKQFRVGLTGGIGSGKSSAAKIFSLLGVPVYNSDERARKLMQSDSKLRAAIIKQFGEQAYTNGTLHSEYLARRVFEDKGQLKRLNNLVHPVVKEDLDRWTQSLSGIVPYHLQEAAILFESGAFKRCGAVICIIAPEDIRIARVMERDSVSETAVRARIDNQISVATRLALSDYVIINDGTHGLIDQVIKLHRKLTDRVHSKK